MAIEIFEKEQQAHGAFNQGEILENKPIGFPQDGGTLRPYSDLFYWAHAYTGAKQSEIGLHPHKGFEILSFVLQGSIEHYDTQFKEWKKLNAGDVQIIRAGSGISHAERLMPHTAMFQIWFDPGLQNSLQKEASYQDYPGHLFPVTESPGQRCTLYREDGGPLEMDSPATIKKMEFQAGRQHLALKESEICSLYIIEGAATLNGRDAGQDAFALISEEKELNIETRSPASLFMIQTPLSLPYISYRELTKNY
jgi:hypothetical protein